jgi:hypothetical protein
VEEHSLDLAVRDGKQERRERLLPPEEHGRRPTVERSLLGAKATPVATRCTRHEGSDTGCAAQRARKIAKPADSHPVASTIADHDGVFGQKLDERARVAGAGGRQERAQEALVLLLRGHDRSALLSDTSPGALEKLATGGRALADKAADDGVIEVENVVKQEHGALGRREALQDYE